MGNARELAWAAGVAVVCAAALLATSPGLPMAWDEGDAITRAEQIPHAWPYTTQIEGHPALYGIVIALGEAATRSFLSPLDAARCGPIMLFAIAAGAMFYRMRRDYSLVAAVGSVAALMLMPRMFAHAHFASFDGPLVSCWILAWALFVTVARERSFWSAATCRRFSLQEGTPNDDCDNENANSKRKQVSALQRVLQVAFGVVLGMAFSCKATGWLAVVPFVVWAVLYRDRRALMALAVGVPVAVLTFLAINPPLWGEPISGLATFFRLNFFRGDNPGLNISTQFFGRMYDLDVPLPWYNTLVWTAITVPVGILAVAGVGFVAAGRRWRSDRLGTLIVANFLVLLVVRAIPGTPPHDAERLILPSFAFLAILAGLGCEVIIGRGRRWGKAALVAVFLGSLTSLVWYAPQWLSYYNLLVGGLRGATALGLEPTYYWDALDQPTLDWLDRHTSPDEAVCFAAAPEENLRLLRKWGRLVPATDQQGGKKFRWYVLQRRPSGMQPVDVWLAEHAAPAYRKSIHSGGWGPWRVDVPLVEIYAYDDYFRGKGELSDGGGA